MCFNFITIRFPGFLIPGNDLEDIVPNTQMELPFWLASYLVEKRNLVKINIPKVYNEKSREIFEADAKVVNLHRINPHFYEFGRYLACLNQREADLVKSLIIKVKQKYDPLSTNLSYLDSNLC